MSFAEIEAALGKLSADDLRRLALKSWTAFVEKEGHSVAANECSEDDPRPGDSQVTGLQLSIDHLLLGQRRVEPRVIEAARRSAGMMARGAIRVEIGTHAQFQRCGRIIQRGEPGRSGDFRGTRSRGEP